MRRDIIIWIIYLLIYINEIVGGSYELVIVPLILIVGYYLINKNLDKTEIYIFGIVGLMLIMWLSPILTFLYITIVIGMKNKFKFINYIILFLTLHIALLMGIVGEGINNLLAMNIISVNGLIIISTITMIHINKEKIKKLEERDRSILNFTILAIIIIIYIILNLIYLIPGNKVEINNVEDFNNIKYNSEVEINKDIDFKNGELEINTLLPFGGNINGNGKELSNIKDEVGVVGTINSLGNINNVKIVNSTFKNVVGINYGEVDKIRVENSKITGNKDVGVVGSNGGTINRVSMDDKTEIIGEVEVGGIAGINSGSIKDSYNAGVVKGNKEVGGIAGINNGSIETTYYTGLVQVDKEDEAEYIGNIAGKQVKNELSLTNVGSEVGVFYDPVYFRENGNENSKYGYSYDDILGQPYEITQSYIKYRDSIDINIMNYLKDNPKITKKDLKKKIDSEIKEYVSELTNIEKNLLETGNKTNDKWYVNNNLDNNIVLTEIAYDFSNENNKIKNELIDSKINEKFLRESIKIIEDKNLQDETLNGSTTGNFPQNEFYLYTNFSSDYRYNDETWNLDNLNAGSSEPIKLN